MKGHPNETVIIDKIKKIYALSNSPVEEEAVSALNRAKENVIERIVLKMNPWNILWTKQKRDDLT